MAQHDYVIANASGAAVRADLNNALAAIVSQNSGAAEPSPTFAHMLWADTANSLLKQRNAGNTAWITVGTLGSANLGLLKAPATSGANGQILSTDGSGTQTWIDLSARISQGTAQASTSGTSIPFGSVPTWAKAITMTFAAVSTTGTSPLQIQLGTSGGYVTSGYLGSTDNFAGTPSPTLRTSGLGLGNSNTAAYTYNGTAKFINVTGNQWAGSALMTLSSGGILVFGATSITLGGALTSIRATTVGGTDTFDAGTIGILYEG